MQYSWFKHFYTMVWVPDMEGDQNLSGILGNPLFKPSVPVWYMNCLSRLHTYVSSQKTEAEPNNLFLGILSGPEPQRSIFQDILWDAGNQLHQPFKLIAGTASQPNNHAVSEFGSIVPHLGGPDLVKAIENSKYIISRGGYTS